MSAARAGDGAGTARDALSLLMVAYGTASLVHHVHNAVFLDSYPNMPAWLTPAHVYAAWLGIAAIGLAAYLLWRRRGTRLAGLLVAGVYGALGFDGLAHYGRAPLSAHTIGMNLTIWLEVLGAAALVIAVAARIVGHLRSRSERNQATARKIEEGHP